MFHKIVGKVQVSSYHPRYNDEVRNLVKSIYAYEEPICRLAGIYKNPDARSELAEDIIEVGDKGMSVMFFDNFKNRVFGFQFANIYTRYNIQRLVEKKIDEAKTSEMKRMYEFDLKQYQKKDMFKEFNVNTVVESMHGMVHPSYSGQGFAYIASKEFLGFVKDTSEGKYPEVLNPKYNLKVPELYYALATGRSSEKVYLKKNFQIFDKVTLEDLVGNETTDGKEYFQYASMMAYKLPNAPSSNN